MPKTSLKGLLRSPMSILMAIHVIDHSMRPVQAFLASVCDQNRTTTETASVVATRSALPAPGSKSMSSAKQADFIVQFSTNHGVASACLAPSRRSRQ